MGEGGFEPPKSLTADLQSVPFGHSGIPPYSLCCTHFETQRSGFKMKRRKAIADMELFASAESGMEQASFDGGAGRRIRTPDLLITNQLLYQLSYTSISATEWILADAASFVKPEFFIFREEWLLHFKICSPAEKRRPYGRPCGRCSLCGCELLRGERGWYLNGQSVCADCFPAFARAELAPCETVFGMEGEA